MSSQTPSGDVPPTPIVSEPEEAAFRSLVRVIEGAEMFESAHPEVRALLEQERSAALTVKRAARYWAHLRIAQPDISISVERAEEAGRAIFLVVGWAKMDPNLGKYVPATQRVYPRNLDLPKLPEQILVFLMGMAEKLLHEGLHQ